MRYKHTKETLQNAVNKSLSIAQVCRELGITPVGGNYKTLKNKFKKFDIDISHFTGKAWNQGLRYKHFGKKYELQEILIENSPYVSTNSLKKRLIKEKLLVEKCSICNIEDWMGTKLTLDLDHINGVNTDHRLSNLRLLCPNCHSQTCTFKGKSKASASSVRKKENYDLFKDDNFVNKLNNIDKTISVSKNKQQVIPVKHCPVCSKNIPTKNKYCSRECYSYENTGNRPSVFDLIESFKLYKNFVQVGLHYKVSDNAVRKWCILYGILDLVKKDL